MAHKQSVGPGPGPGVYKEEPAPVGDPARFLHIYSSRDPRASSINNTPTPPINRPALSLPIQATTAFLYTINPRTTNPDQQRPGTPRRFHTTRNQVRTELRCRRSSLPMVSSILYLGLYAFTVRFISPEELIMLIEPSDLMAATQMQRPYQSVYHTPQSNSPVSVASSQSHDPNARLYGQPPPQMQQPMYGYPQYQPSMNQNYPAAYAQHSSQQQQQPQTQPPQQHPSMNSQPQIMLHQQPQPQPQQPSQQPPPMSHAQTQSQSSSMATNSPRMKFEPQAIQQRPLDPSSLAQRPQSGPTSTNLNAPSGPQTNGHLHPGQGGAGGGGGANGVNPNAAPGPIPATTPLVVRQDESGVQWILFEYSRDRVKMEYTIRCDVESVNVDQLGPDFKNENCVYPRACCNKDQYRGNRLAYETECNTVGWALAELNPCLRGKRGLIQRAVDSWRNSNQDPRLRSRRVRRMAKINTRKQVQASHPNHLAGPGGPGAPTGISPSTNSMAAPVQRPPPSNVNMGSSSLHHHHAHPDGSPAGIKDEVSANGAYTPQQRQHQALPKQSSPNDIRQSQVFHGYPHFPPQAAQSSVSLTPSLHDGIDGPLSGHPTAHPASSSSAIAASAPAIPKLNDNSHDESNEHRAPSAVSTNVYGDLPEAKRRKFIIVEDIERNNQNVRIRANLDPVDVAEIPDSYRKTYSVYPRSYYPIQMPSPTRKASKGNRFFEDDEPGGGNASGQGAGEEEAVMGRTMVPVPMLEGAEGEVAVPKIGRAKRRREEMVNDLGNRMIWTHSRVFSERTMYLQRALDIYRNKMRTTVSAGGQQVSVVAPHLETRLGKRKWLERKGKARLKAEVDPS
ncbi:MAG: hypothetical protein Q9188_004897 [Gyalolechia gomerana]